MHSDLLTTPWGTLDYVDANGLRFAYFAAGSGPLALLLHGFPDTPHGFNALAPALVAAGYRVVAPFTRGYHPTEVPHDRTISVMQLAHDAVALIEALGHRSAAALIGHDWGAATAYMAATLAPERIDKLVTIGIPHLATIKPTLRLAWLGRHFLGLRLPGAVGRLRRNDGAAVDALYRRWSPTWRYAPSETALAKACFAHADSADAALGYYRGLARKPLMEAFRPTISVPTLVFAGVDDPALSPAVYASASRKFTGGYRVVALPGGHFVHRESPDAFRAAVLAFLAAPATL